MRILYSFDSLAGSFETFEKSIFLAGPTPRDERVDSWRPAALGHLIAQGYNGTVIVPELEGGALDWAKLEASRRSEVIEWETDALLRAGVIMFWVPRNMQTLPGLTTNIEFGEHMASGRIVLGYPPEAEHMGAMAYHANRLNIPTFSTLRETVKCAIERA